MSSRVALPIVPVRVKGKGCNNYITTHALLDTGSDRIFCSQSLIKRLNINGVSTSLSLSTLNDNKESDVVEVSLEVSSVIDTESPAISLPIVFAVQTFPTLVSSIARTTDIEMWEHLKDLPIPHVDASDVTLIIGQDVPDALYPLEKRKGKVGEPYAIRTPFGWTVNGPVRKIAVKKPATCNFINSLTSSDTALENQVAQF